MNILIQLSHPAHYHLYKNVAKNLMVDGHKIVGPEGQTVSSKSYLDGPVG